jgi:CheY-like chemotaxis protein
VSLLFPVPLPLLLPLTHRHRHIQDTYTKFLEYITARSQLQGTSCKALEDSDEIPTSHLKRFLCHSHQSLLWPVNMMHKQVTPAQPLRLPPFSCPFAYLQLQKFLYGSKFWEKSRSQHFFTFLDEKGIVSDCFLFVDVLFKIHSASASKVNLDEIWNQHWSPDLGPISTTLAYDIFLAQHARSGRGRLDKRFADEKQSHPERIPSPCQVGLRDPGLSNVEGSESDSDSDDSTEDRSGDISGKRVRLSRSSFTNSANLSSAPSVVAPSPPPVPGKSLKDLRILVIEDSIFQRKLIVRGLMKCLGEELTDYEDKWPVVSIGNGEEAFQLLESSQRYDIFIVDENLDGTGGILKGHEVQSLSVSLCLSLEPPVSLSLSLCLCLSPSLDRSLVI